MGPGVISEPAIKGVNGASAIIFMKGAGVFEQWWKHLMNLGICTQYSEGTFAGKSILLLGKDQRKPTSHFR